MQEELKLCDCDETWSFDHVAGTATCSKCKRIYPMGKFMSAVESAPAVCHVCKEPYPDFLECAGWQRINIRASGGREARFSLCPKHALVISEHPTSSDQK